MKRVCLLMIAASSAGAQVSLRGLAYDSLHGRALPGAFVGIVGLKATAVSDSAGRFVLAGVPPGTYRVVMQHDVLDAIGISAAGATAVVKADGDSVVVAVPSFTTLWRAACGRPAPQGTDSGFVFGTVSRGGKSAASALVDATWNDGARERSIQAAGDSAGNFALCGLPTNAALQVRARAGNGYCEWSAMEPIADRRLVRHDLRITAVSAMRFDLPDATSFSGRVVLDSTTQPLAGADVLVMGTGRSASTNERGEFRIAGVPPGSHVVQVRKVGFSFTEQPVDFGKDPVERTLAMSRITTLDSVKVVAPTYSPNDEAMRLFEEHRKIGLGKFFTRADLEQHRDMRMSELLGQVPGVKPQTGNGGEAWIMPNRGAKSLGIGPGGASSVCDPPKQDHPEARRIGPPCTNACFPHLFVDDVDVSPTEVPNINRYSPDQIEAIEYYAGGAQVPIDYNRLNRAACGVIIIHTRRGK